VAEAGFPEFDVVIWNALFAPAHTPAEIVSRLNGEINGILAQAQLRSTLIDQGAEPRPMDLPSLAQFIREDYTRWGRVVRAAGIQAD
jgi:tripartite-type tricarboxylate transporter receptor subunit TctC